MLLHIARQIYPDIPAVFSNTGLEYSSIQRFVKTWDNVDIVVPKMNFVQVVSTYGYPLIGKEVAEAIYYARRLSSQNGHVEREREADGRYSTDAKNCWADGQPYPDKRSEKQKNDTARQMGREPANKRTELGGQTRRRAEISGALTTDENLNRSRRTGVVGKPMNHGRETDGCSTGSEVPPG